MMGFQTLNEARGKLARKAAQFNARHARGRRLPAVILMTDDARVVDWVWAVSALPAGCAVVVRHRDTRARDALARRLRPVCAARRIRLLIAEDPALALRVRADGVHLAQGRLARSAALKALHPRWLLTAAVHDRGAAAAASRLGVDAVLISPAFPTASHPGRTALGVVRLSAIARGVRPAVYALGGIDAISVQRLSALPLNGVALIGGWIKA